ncbi:Uncharacterised protein [Mycobacteroides abscessus]|nr:Uncharacterised protein [Mycobacteroides abscessus]
MPVAGPVVVPVAGTVAVAGAASARIEHDRHPVRCSSARSCAARDSDPRARSPRRSTVQRHSGATASLLTWAWSHSRRRPSRAR